MRSCFNAANRGFAPTVLAGGQTLLDVIYVAN